MIEQNRNSARGPMRVVTSKIAGLFNLVNRSVSKDECVKTGYLRSDLKRSSTLTLRVTLNLLAALMLAVAPQGLFAAGGGAQSIQSFVEIKNNWADLVGSSFRIEGSKAVILSLTTPTLLFLLCCIALRNPYATCFVSKPPIRRLSATRRRCALGSWRERCLICASSRSRTSLQYSRTEANLAINEKSSVPLSIRAFNASCLSGTSITATTR